MEVDFFPALGKLAECMNTELAKVNSGGFCYSGLWFGEGEPPIMMLDCDSGCAVAWVRPSEVFASTIFPTPDDALMGCTSSMAIRFEMGVARCFPTPAPRAVYPDEQRVFEASMTYMSDMDAMRKATMCCFAEDDAFREYDVALERWAPIPLEAGYTGGTWTGVIGHV